MQKVEAAAQDIRDIQMELQQRMTKVIVDEGMEIQEFQDIILAYQYSPKVQKKINTLLEQSQGAPADSGQTTPAQPAPSDESPTLLPGQTGRATCRERVCQY